jgi:D-glycero-D-manno-heptose 1,7-bisphosphate phosphatase
VKPAVFLDRDGTLFEDSGYLCMWEQAEVFPFTVPALRLLRQCGFLLVVVTNQSAVSRGLCSESQVQAFHLRMSDYFATHNLTFDGIYYCPYHRDAVVAEYRCDHPWRKPAPGMLLQAALDLGIDLGRSYMIGDHESDMLAGIAAGCRPIFVRTGHGEIHVNTIHTSQLAVAAVCDNLLQAAEFIHREWQQENGPLGVVPVDTQP